MTIEFEIEILILDINLNNDNKMNDCHLVVIMVISSYNCNKHKTLNDNNADFLSYPLSMMMLTMKMTKNRTKIIPMAPANV